MSINTQYQGNIAPCHLTNLPTVLWSLSASFLSFKDLGRLSVTHRVFIEALTKLTDEQKEFLEQCRNYPSFPHGFWIMETDKSPHFSIPVLLQLKSLTSLNDDMIKQYEKTVEVSNNSKGVKVLSKCESLRKIYFNNHDFNYHYFEGLKTCLKLREITLKNTTLDVEYFADFLISNGAILENICLKSLYSTSHYNILNSIILNCPNLNTLTITNHFMRNPCELALLPNLTALTINGICHNLNLEDLIPLISSRAMTIINVHTKMPITQKYIDALENNANRLEHLCLSQEYVRLGPIFPVTFSGLLSRLENIKFLNLYCCDISNFDLEILVKHAHQLNYLYLKDNSKITFEPIKKIIESLPLKQISVYECENVNVEQLRIAKEKKDLY